MKLKLINKYNKFKRMTILKNVNKSLTHLTQFYVDVQRQHIKLLKNESIIKNEMKIMAKYINMK